MLIHRVGSTFEAKTLDEFDCGFQALGYELFFFGGEAAEHPIDLPSFGEIATDAEAESGETFATALGGDILEPVMSACRSFGAHTKRSEGECDIVTYDEYVIERNLLGLHPVADGIAREVHVRVGLENFENLVFESEFAGRSIAIFMQLGIVSLCEGICYAKSDVVTCSVIFFSDIAESDDEKFHLLLICWGYLGVEERNASGIVRLSTLGYRTHLSL